MADLEATLRRVPADLVLDASPVDLARLLDPHKPIVRVHYQFRVRGDELAAILERFEREALHRRPVEAV